jgi:hypothetical protein
VMTCTAHSERIHRETNENCPRSRNLLRRMEMLITIVTRQFEGTSEFRAE